MAAKAETTSSRPVESLVNPGTVLLDAIRASAIRTFVAEQGLDLLREIDEFHAERGHDDIGILRDEHTALRSGFWGRENAILHRAVKAKGLLGRAITVRAASTDTYARFQADTKGEEHLLSVNTDLAVQPGFVATGTLRSVNLLDRGSIHLDDCVAGYEGYQRHYKSALVTGMIKLGSIKQINEAGIAVPLVQLEFDN